MKKIKSFFSKLLRKKKLKSYEPDPNTSFTVRNINPDGEDLAEGLGMSEERAKELYRAVEAELPKHKDLGSLAEAVTPMCKHANELFMMTLAIKHLTSRGSGGVKVISIGIPRPGED